MKIYKTIIAVIVITLLAIPFLFKNISQNYDKQSSNSTFTPKLINTDFEKDTRFASIIPYSSDFSLIPSQSPGVRTRNVPLSGNLDQMKYYFRALKNSRSGKIRVAHYGDSIILGDVITEYLRESHQKRFGGEGAGFLSIASKDNKMRRSVLHSFSSDWELTSIFTRNPKKLPLGMSSIVSIPGSNSWAQYEKTNFINSLGPFKMARLFYSHANNGGKVYYKTNGSSKESLILKNGSRLNEEVIKFSPSVSSLKFEFVSCQNTYFYGVSLENGNGVYIDNFPITGNSGVSLVDIPLELMKQFDKMLNYKLIILNFGVNVGSPKRGTYTLYENKMLKVIKHLQKAFPETSILIIGVADRTVKRGSKFMTDPDIPILLKSQKKIAQKAKVAFWNLYEAMGGKNSMNTWVNSAPPMALKDYRHFTHDGGKIVAGLIYDALMDEFRKY